MAQLETRQIHHSSSCLLLSGLELSGTKIYASFTHARLGTTAHFCKVVVLHEQVAQLETQEIHQLFDEHQEVSTPPPMWAIRSSLPGFGVPLLESEFLSSSRSFLPTFGVPLLVSDLPSQRHTLW